MADWAQRDGGGVVAGDLTTTNPYGVILPNSGVNLTYGAWTTITASVPFETQGLYVCAMIVTSATGQAVFDIGMGTAGNEVVLVQAAYVPSTQQRMTVFRFPIQVPAGVRLAGRMQANSNTTGTVAVAPYFQRRGFLDEAGLTTSTLYGWTSASMTAGGPASSASPTSKGSWVQIMAATATAHQALAVQLYQFASGVARFWHTDIGVGAVGAEQVLLADLYMAQQSGTEADFTEMGPFFVSLPVGTRLSARCAVSTAGVSTQNMGLRCYS
jgi:hypothetical protein